MTYGNLSALHAGRDCPDKGGMSTNSFAGKQQMSRAHWPANICHAHLHQATRTILAAKAGNTANS